MTHKTTSIPGLATPEAAAPQASEALRYTSSDLFKGQSEILIEHQGAEYRLRITRSGGLILNK
jgi:hemin uptake protein HemP